MGYMTTITILNDAFSEIEKRPEEFVKSIKEGMAMDLHYTKGISPGIINTFPIGDYSNYVSVATSHHANESRLYLVGENLMSILGNRNDIQNLEFRKANLEIAKRIIEEEEASIKKLENI